MAAGQAAAERPIVADEVFLADELLKVPRPHPGREGLPFRRGLEERLRTRAGEPGRGPSRRHGRSLRGGPAAAGDQPGPTPTTFTRIHSAARIENIKAAVTMIRRTSRAT